MAWRRWSVIDMSELIAANLRACSAGIRPSNEFSTHTHFALSFAQTALPTSISKPCSSPAGDFDSNGAYDASTPKRISLISAACAPPAAPAVMAATQNASVASLFQFVFISVSFQSDWVRRRNAFLQL